MVAAIVGMLCAAGLVTSTAALVRYAIRNELVEP
jgi:hypothetical protein